MFPKAKNLEDTKGLLLEQNSLGRCVDLAHQDEIEKIGHPIYRDGRALFIPLKIGNKSE